MSAGKIYAQRMGFPFHLKAQQMGMRELVDFSKLGLEENIGAMITTRSFLAQRRETVLRYLRAYIRGMHRFKTDKEFAKKVYGKFALINDEALARSQLARICGHMLRSPRPTLKGIQQVIDSGTSAKSMSKQSGWWICRWSTNWKRAASSNRSTKNERNRRSCNIAGCALNSGDGIRCVTRELICSCSELRV